MATYIDKIESCIERQDILNLIPGYELGYITKRKGIKKDIISGYIGERGGGKSGSAAVVALLDYGMDGIPIFSNMKIACDIEIDDITARKYGLSYGGIARYRSLPVDMPRLLCFDEMYRNSHILLDEINVEVSEARRSMSNTNLFSNKLAQELRHLESSISFTCISEMAIDSRWRDIVDIFIRSEDTAYFPENIEVGKPQGVDFKWTGYYMNKCFNGHTYQETSEPGFKAMFHFKPWRGVYDDKEFQGRGMKRYGVDLKKGNSAVSIGDVQIEAAPEVDKHFEKWAWFEKVYLRYKDIGPIIPAETIWSDPEVVARKVGKIAITRELESIYNVKANRPWDNDKGKYVEYYTFPGKNDESDGDDD